MVIRTYRFTNIWKNFPPTWLFIRLQSRIRQQIDEIILGGKIMQNSNLASNLAAAFFPFFKALASTSSNRACNSWIWCSAIFRSASNLQQVDEIILAGKSIRIQNSKCSAIFVPCCVILFHSEFIRQFSSIKHGSMSLVLSHPKSVIWRDYFWRENQNSNVFGGKINQSLNMLFTNLASLEASSNSCLTVSISASALLLAPINDWFWALKSLNDSWQS